MVGRGRPDFSTLDGPTSINRTIRIRGQANNAAPGLGELHIGPAFVLHEPAFGERAVDACPELAGTAAGLQGTVMSA